MGSGNLDGIVLRGVRQWWVSFDWLLMLLIACPTNSSVKAQPRGVWAVTILQSLDVQLEYVVTQLEEIAPLSLRDRTRAP